MTQVIFVGLILVLSASFGFLIGLAVAGYRQELENIQRQIEIDAVIRNKKTDVVDRTYCFEKDDGYVMFKLNQN